MADTRRNSIPLLPLILFWLCLSQAYVSARLVQIRHRVRGGKQVNFLAVGDWGRKGGYNQSAVAQSVRTNSLNVLRISVFFLNRDFEPLQMGVIGEKLGINFVISTGDNFYSDGLTGTNDPAFAESFTKVYSAKSLHKPWYASKFQQPSLSLFQYKLSLDLHIM